MLLVRAVLLTLFMCLPLHASALAVEDSVFELSVDVKTLLLKYYHVQADEGNTQRIAELLQQRDQVVRDQAALLSQLDGRYSGYRQSIGEHWSTFNSLLDQNLSEIRESNYPELQVVTMMREAQRAMLTQLDQLSDTILSDNEVSLSQFEEWQRAQKNLMLTVVERYIERAASSMGAPLTIDEVDISVLCKQFDRGILELQGKLSAPEARTTLNKIRSQWLFIETAATNEEARLVPFLVMRYTDTILGRLDDLEQFI